MSQRKQEKNRLKRMKNQIYRNNPVDRLTNNCCYQLIPDVTTTKSPKILKRATPASTLYYGDLPEIMHPTIEFDKLNPLKNLATPSLVHHVPVILTPNAVTVKPIKFLKSSTTTKSPNQLPKVPKNLEVFIPLFKPVWTLHKIMEKLFQDFTNGKIEEYLKVYPK